MMWTGFTNQTGPVIDPNRPVSTQRGLGYEGMGVNNLPGVCRCSHSRQAHVPVRGRCTTEACECVDFRGPTAPSYNFMGRGWPLVYMRRGGVAHILPAWTSPDSSDPASCGRDPWPYCWRGTSNHKENIKAESLPLCARCEEHIKQWYSKKETQRLKGQ